MVFLENLKSELEALRPIISELHDVYDIERSQERIAELHEKAAEPNFWDDMEKSQKVLQETRNLEGKLEKYSKFKSSFEDIEVLIEMAADEGGEDMIDEIQSELKTLKVLTPHSLTLCSQASMITTTLSSTFMQEQAELRRRIGAKCFSGCIINGVKATASK